MEYNSACKRCSPSFCYTKIIKGNFPKITIHPQQPDQNAFEIGSLSVHNLNLIWATCDMPHYCCSVYAHALAYTLGLPPQLTCETRRRSYNRQSGSHTF